MVPTCFYRRSPDRSHLAPARSQSQRGHARRLCFGLVLRVLQDILFGHHHQMQPPTRAGANFGRKHSRLLRKSLSGCSSACEYGDIGDETNFLWQRPGDEVHKGMFGNHTIISQPPPTHHQMLPILENVTEVLCVVCCKSIDS